MNHLAIITLRKEPHYRSAAFAKGLARLGYHVVMQAGPSTFRPAGRHDLLVLWNKKRGLEERQADEWEAAGGTIIVAENAYLQKVDKSMYAVSTHDHNGAGWFPVSNEDRFSSLGFDLKPEVNRPGPILVTGQRGIGSVRMASPPQWAEEKVKQLGGGAFLRPHPGNFAPKKPLVDDLASARAVFTWSSAAGVRALVEGLPVCHFAPSWICDGTFDGRPREEALHEMSHGQWTVAEIESGEPFARMRAYSWGPRTWR